MHVILAVMTSSPYRDAIRKFAEQFADLLDGKVRLATLAQRQGPDDASTSAQSSEDEEALVERAEADVEEKFVREDEGRETPHETVWLGGPPIEDCVRELAKCDFGVVGKALHGEPSGGSAIGEEVDQLKRHCTKPLIIVPKEVRPIRKALFVYTEHPESGHALYLAKPLSEKGVQIKLVTAIGPLGQTELIGTGAGYLQAHGVSFEAVEADCENCTAEGGPTGEILHIVRQEHIDLVIMGGTRRGLLGRLLWPEMAREVVWNAHVPVLIWY